MGANAARRLQGRPSTFGNALEGTILEPSTVGNPTRTNFAFSHDPYDLRQTQFDGQYSLDVWQTLSHGRVSHVPPEELVEPTCEAILGLRYPDNLDLSHARISKEQAATEAKETEESITHILTEICGDLSGRHVIADFALKEQGTGTMWRTTVQSHQSDHGKAMQLAMSEAGDTLNPDLNAALVARRSQIRNPVDEITLAVSRTPGSNPSLSAYASLPSNQSGNEPFRTAVTELDPRTLWPFLTFLSSNAASANALSSRLDSTSRREHGVPWPPRTLTLPDDLRPSDIIKRAQLSAAVAQRS